jgi:hypothetical protein
MEWQLEATLIFDYREEKGGGMNIGGRWWVGGGWVGPPTMEVMMTVSNGKLLHK